MSICHLLHLNQVDHISMAVTTSVELRFLQMIPLRTYNQLKFHNETNFVVTKANRTLAIVRKSFNFTDKMMFLNL